MEKMRLAKSGVSVDEEWVIGSAGIGGDSLGCGCRELIGRPDHESLEGELGRERRSSNFWARLGLLMVRWMFFILKDNLEVPAVLTLCDGEEIPE